MEIKLINAQKALALTNIELADYVINPYKGCQIGCLYCYTRTNKAIQKEKKEWGEYVYVKHNIPELLEKELSGIQNIKRVLIGSTTEPLQPVEEKYKITYDVLKILKSHDIPVVILSKINFIVNYLDLLDYSKKNKIYFTYNSEIIWEMFEKRSYPPKDRLKIIESINNSNIDMVVYIGPVFPFLTNVKKIYFEGYNAKLGNWTDIKEKMDENLILNYKKIFFIESEYDKYWDDFITQTNELNKKFGFDLQYFIYPFDSFYN